MTPDADPSLPDYRSLLFRVAYMRGRFYCGGCICLTLDERTHQQRVFRLVRAWSKALRDQQVKVS